MPAYNTEATIGESIASGLASTYGNLELLVVDDGSDDSTARIAEDFARQDPRVQVHRRSRGGVSAAFNLGLERSRGEYIARLDSDDIWHPAKLEKQMAVAAANPALGLVYTFVRYIDADGLVVRDPPPQIMPPNPLCRLCYEGLIGGNSSAVMRRSAVIEAGGYDETLSSWEDLLLHLAISESHSIGFVPEYLVGYRLRPGSLSADWRNMLDSWRAARLRIERRFPQIPRRVRNWSHGTRLIQLAGNFLRTGQYALSAKLILEALVHDPQWTSVFLSYQVRRRLSGSGIDRVDDPRAEAWHFGDCDPGRSYKLNKLDSGAEGQSFIRFEEARRRRLDGFDVKLAARRPSLR